MRLARRVLLYLSAASAVSSTSPNTAKADDPAGSQPAAISKSGIPYRPDGEQAGPPELVDAIRARRKGGKLLHLDRMLLHSPPFAQAWNTMFGTIRGKLSVPAKLRELAIVSIGAINHADYEWGQHAPEFLAAGGTREQLDALRDPRAALSDSKRFDEAERATLALTYEMTREVAVTPATLKRVRALLPDSQVVELIGVVAGYNMVSRFVVATGVEMEP
jgi:alkylhydroperoxidase family enzyme